MKNINQYKFYKTFVQVNELSHSIKIIKYLILTVHAISIIFLMLLNMQSQLQDSAYYVSFAIQTLNQQVLTDSNATVISYFGLAFTFLLIICGTLRLYLLPQQDQVSKYKKLQKATVVIQYVLIHSYQLSMYIILWSYSQIYYTQGLVLLLVKSFIPIVSCTYFNFKYQTPSLYRWYTVPLVLQLTLIENFFSYILIIAVSTYFILTAKDFFSKVLYSFVIILSIFVLKNTKVFDNGENTEITIPLVCLGISILLIPVLIFKLNEKINLQNNEEQIKRCFQVLNLTKGDYPRKQMKFSEFFEIYNNVISLTLASKDEKSSEIQDILDKKPEEVTKDDFFFLLEKHLQKQLKKASDDNLPKQILLLKIRMALNQPMNILIEELFLVQDELKRSNKKHQNEFFRLYDAVVKKFAVYKNSELQAAHINHINKLHENFESRVIVQMEKLTKFWDCLAQQQVKRGTLDACFEEVLRLECQIENMYKDMEKLGSFEREKKLIELTRSMLNAYDDDSKVSAVQTKRPNDHNDNEMIHSFLILEDKFIKFISKDLLKSLDENGSLSLENVDKKALFGEEFSQIVDTHIQGLNSKNQNEEITIPIFTKKGFMQLKRVKILWYPSLESKNRYLIKFSEDQELANEAFFIYHCKTDTIRYFNQKVIQNFGIDHEKFQYQLNNYQIFFNELFVSTDIPAEEIKNVLRDEQTIRCKIFLKKYVEAGATASVPIEIKALKCISIENETTYCILKISKLKEKKQLGSEMASDKNKHSIKEGKFMSSNENVLAKKYEHETFFCKIPNHFESKITQKQAQLDESGRWIYRYFIHALFGLTFVSVFVFQILDYNLMQSRITSYKKQNLSLQNVSQQYALLYQCYSIAVKRYYIQKYPQQTLLVKHVPGVVFDGIYANVQQTFLDQFLKRYLTQINSQPNSRIPYGLDFDYFSIQTDTDKSTLMDFAQNVKRNIATGSLDFLLKNYNSFRNLTIAYETAFSYESSIRDIISSSTMYFWILISSSSVAIVIILYTLFKIEAAIEIVYSLIELIPLQEYRKHARRNKKKQQKFIDVFYQIIGSKQQKSHKILKLKSQQASIAQKLKNTTNLKIPQSINQINQINDNISQSDHNQNDITQTKKFIQIQQTKDIKRKQKIMDQSIVIKMYRKIFFIILILTIDGIFLYEYQTLMKQQDGIIQMLNIKRDLYIGLLNVKRKQVDTAMKPTMENYYNTTISADTYGYSKLNLISEIQNDIILDQLKSFGEDARRIFSSNLCLMIGGSIKAASKPCQSYLQGVVLKGFGQTFQLYQQNSKIVINQKMVQFGQYPCTVAKCSPYYQHQFVSILLGQNVRYVLITFNSKIDIAFNLMIQKVKLKTIYKILGLILGGIIYLICDQFLKKRCKKAIKYFRIIPKQMMCSIKITTYMRKNKVLNKFDIL